MARVIEGHELISQGPYAVVRNPIYLAMLGMLIATGLGVSQWPALVVRGSCVLGGHCNSHPHRRKSAAPNFGAKFDDYARARARIPAAANGR